MRAWRALMLDFGTPENDIRENIHHIGGIMSECVIPVSENCRAG